MGKKEKRSLPDAFAYAAPCGVALMLLAGSAGGCRCDSSRGEDTRAVHSIPQPPASNSLTKRAGRPDRGLSVRVPRGWTCEAPEDGAAVALNCQGRLWVAQWSIFREADARAVAELAADANRAAAVESTREGDGALYLGSCELGSGRGVVTSPNQGPAHTVKLVSWYPSAQGGSLRVEAQVTSNRIAAVGSDEQKRGLPEAVLLSTRLENPGKR